MYDKYNDLLARLEEPLVKPRGRSRFHKLMHLLSFVHAFTIHFQVCSTSNSYSYSSPLRWWIPSCRRLQLCF
ncbi:hypothetical protein PISMIDRAFT_682109, partial [Pisolithus microcarpus 441]